MLAIVTLSQIMAARISIGMLARRRSPDGDRQTTMTDRKYFELLGWLGIAPGRFAFQTKTIPGPA